MATSTTLYGPDGKPVRSSRLSREQAVGSVTSVRSPYEPIVAAGMTPKKLQALLSRAKDGDHHDYLVLASEMEQRDGHYFSQLRNRRLALVQLQRTVEAASEAGEDVRVADAVKEWLFSPALGSALDNILDATGKGFSVTEIVWKRAEEMWQPVAFKYRPQRWFFFERERAEELRLHDGSDVGEALDPFKYVCHVPHVFAGLPIAGGMARIVAALHVFKGYAVKDWMAFAEVFGMPIRIGRYAQGADDAAKEELRRAVTDIGSDAAAVIPNTMEIIFERASMSGNAGSDEFFMTLADWLNGEVSKAVLGQTMTTENGSSLAQAQVHDRVRTEIRNADAWQLANTLQRDIVVPFVDLNFGARPKDSDYPHVNFETEEPEDLESFAKAITPFIDRGLRVSEAAVMDKFGLTEPRPDERLLTAAGPAPSPDDDGEDEDGDGKTGAERDEDGEASRAELRATISTIVRRANSATNMRQFRRELDELVRLRGRSL